MRSPARISLSRRVPEALELLALVEAPLRNHPDPQFRGWFHSDYARALLLSDRLAQADQQLDAGLAIARQVGRQRMICGMLAIKGQVAAAAGLINEPVERFHEALLAIADLEPSVITRSLQVWLATSLIDTGRYREALASIETALVVPAAIDPAWLGRELGLRALIYAHLGQRRLALQSEAACERTSAAPMVVSTRLIEKIEIDWILGAPLDERIEQASAKSRRSARGRPTGALRWPQALARHGAIDAKAMETLHRDATDHGLLGHALAARLALALAAAGRGDAQPVRRQRARRAPVDAPLHAARELPAAPLAHLPRVAARIRSRARASGVAGRGGLDPGGRDASGARVISRRVSASQPGEPRAAARRTQEPRSPITGQ